MSLPAEINYINSFYSMAIVSSVKLASVSAILPNPPPRLERICYNEAKARISRWTSR